MEYALFTLRWSYPRFLAGAFGGVLSSLLPSGHTRLPGGLVFGSGPGSLVEVAASADLLKSAPKRVAQAIERARKRLRPDIVPATEPRLARFFGADVVSGEIVSLVALLVWLERLMASDADVEFALLGTESWECIALMFCLCERGYRANLVSHADPKTQWIAHRVFRKTGLTPRILRDPHVALERSAIVLVGTQTESLQALSEKIVVDPMGMLAHSANFCDNKLVARGASFDIRSRLPDQANLRPEETNALLEASLRSAGGIPAIPAYRYATREILILKRRIEAEDLCVFAV